MTQCCEMFRTVVIILALFPVNLIHATYLSPINVVLSSFQRMVQFRDTLTTVVVPLTGARVVQSSGGAAGGVVSEGQGYGLLIGGTVVASLNPADPRWAVAVTFTYQLFLGWKRMCQLTNQGSCQQGGFNCGGIYPCLPNWKFDSGLTAALGTGSAPDGDEDAILGMILFAQATRSRGFPWWTELAAWAYNSSKAFADFDTSLSPNGKNRIVRLGSCFGGWDCSNPSYFAPGHYRVFRDYMLAYNTVEGQKYVPLWNNLVNTTYLVLQANQCPSSGLVTNWYVPNPSSPSTGGSVVSTCDFSGTPPAQYGSEACRTPWRVTLDYLWYPDQSQNAGNAAFARRVASEVTSKLKLATSACMSVGCNQAIKLDIPASCFVKSVLDPWTDIMFMFGPLSVSLMVPLLPTDPQASFQQNALNLAALKVNRTSLVDYYSGSWLTITTMTLSQDLVCANPYTAQCKTRLGKREHAP